MWSSFPSIEYVDVASGVMVQLALTVNWVPVLDEIVRIWPAPVPPVIRTCWLVHWFVVHAFAELDRVFAVADVAVPVANDTKSLYLKAWVARRLHSENPEIGLFARVETVFVARSKTLKLVDAVLDPVRE